MKNEDFLNAIEALKGTNAKFQITDENDIWLSSACHSVIQRLLTRGFSLSLYRPEGHEENYLSVSNF